MTPCIEHTQTGDSRGYGTARIPGTRRRTTLHRRVYAESNGKDFADIDGVLIRHTCDNPRCINPEHLIEGIPQDNMQDKVDQGRCPKPGALLTESQVNYIHENYKAKCKVNGAKALAIRFGVSLNTVWRVAAGVTFK